MTYTSVRYFGENWSCLQYFLYKSVFQLPFFLVASLENNFEPSFIRIKGRLKALGSAKLSKRLPYLVSTLIYNGNGILIMTGTGSCAILITQSVLFEALVSPNLKDHSPTPGWIVIIYEELLYILNILDIFLP